MTIVQYLSAFRVYGADVLVLALGVTLVTSLLKKTVLKKCPKKVFVFLPFAIGLAFYSAFRAVVTLSAEPFTSGLAETLEGGFACGCAATLYYVVYEQFLRATNGEKTASVPPVSALLSGMVPEERIAAAAEELTEGAKTHSEEELFGFVSTALHRYAGENGERSEAEFLLYAKTVTAFLLKTRE